jgi:hypothetical protein
MSAFLEGNAIDGLKKPEAQLPAFLVRKERSYAAETIKKRPAAMAGR